MKLSFTPQADSNEAKLAALAEIEATLLRIKPNVSDHLCPNNSPSGHHDVEALGQEATFCRVFKLGCPHPLTAESETELPSETLKICLDSLGNLGAIPAQKHAELAARLYRAHATLWNIDTARRTVLGHWRNTRVQAGDSEADLAAKLPEFSADLDERHRETQNESILQRMSVIIEIQAAILHCRHTLASAPEVVPVRPSDVQPVVTEGRTLETILTAVRAVATRLKSFVVPG